MAGSFDAVKLRQPISADAPCGPDLDLEGDTSYFQSVSRVEGLLPSSYFKRDDDGKLIAFDRSTIDFAVETRALVGLLERSRDLRILTMLGRLQALNRDLAGFADSIALAATLLVEFWDDVHPHGEDGDFLLRAAILQAFDEMPTVILPLQHMPLAQTRRTGPIAFRAIMVANGEVQPRTDEAVFDRPAIDRILTEADLADLQATRDRLAAIQGAVRAIQATSIEKGGFDQAVSFERLPTLVERMLAALDPVLRARDPGNQGVADMPSLVAATDQPASHLPTIGRVAGSINTGGDAVRALTAVSGYLQHSLPSSPATLLIRQAEGLIGKSFLDVIRILVPSHADRATISIGADRLFELSYQQLSEVTASEEAADPTATDEKPDLPEQAFQPASRAESLALMQQIGSYYRSAEPSSPIPLLLDRAAGMMERDFLSLLKDVLPSLSARKDDY